MQVNVLVDGVRQHHDRNHVMCPVVPLESRDVPEVEIAIFLREQVTVSNTHFQTGFQRMAAARKRLLLNAIVTCDISQISKVMSQQLAA
jgi:hypothetical protein